MQDILECYGSCAHPQRMWASLLIISFFLSIHICLPPIIRLTGSDTNYLLLSPLFLSLPWSCCLSPLGMPSFIMSPNDQTGISGGVASFVCQVVGEPKPQITWMKKGKKVSSQRFEVRVFSRPQSFLSDMLKCGEPFLYLHCSLVLCFLCDKKGGRQSRICYLNVYSVTVCKHKAV